jgi:hypothetical protein
MAIILEKMGLDNEPRQLYQPPAIIHELDLETRAGSPAPTLEPIIPGEDELLQP